MKIALVNYRYFISGGPERYMFNIKGLLEDKGHQVIPFSIKHNNNVSTIYDSFFLDPIGSGNEVYSHEYKKTFINISRVTGRMLYSLEAKKKFKAFLRATSPDIIYILQFQNKISCSIIDTANELKIPIVQRISDFGHICPNALLYRNDNGICEECLKMGFHMAIKHKCISNSYLASVLKTFSLIVMNQLGIKNKIKAFVFPSKFTLNKYENAEFKSDKLYHIPTFFNFSNSNVSKEIKYGNFALYIGRISKEKGIKTMIDAFINTKFNLKIIGYSNDDLENKIKSEFSGKIDNIEFLGRMDFSEISKFLRNCLFTIVPSECYDNFPNSVLESFAFKKAVVASNVGSLPELVVDEKTGILFEAKNHHSLREKVKKLINNKQLCIELGENAFKYLEHNCSKEEHYEKLMSLFKGLISNN